MGKATDNIARNATSLLSDAIWTCLSKETGKDISIGRSYRDAPKIDGLVLVKGEHTAGDMVSVHIDNAMEYDLMGTVNTNPDNIPL